MVRGSHLTNDGLFNLIWNLNFFLLQYVFKKIDSPTLKLFRIIVEERNKKNKKK